MPERNKYLELNSSTEGHDQDMQARVHESVNRNLNEAWQEPPSLTNLI